MKRLLCALLSVMTVFILDINVFAVSPNQKSGDISISFYEKGDVNRDKKVDQKDAERLLQYTAGWDLNVTVKQSEADLNRDGVIDGLDAIQLLQQLVGMK